MLVLVLQNVDYHHAFSLSSIGYLGITLPVLVLATGSTVLALLSVTQHYPALVRIIQRLSALFSRSGIFQRFDPFVHLRASIHSQLAPPIRYRKSDVISVMKSINSRILPDRAHGFLSDWHTLNIEYRYCGVFDDL